MQIIYIIIIIIIILLIFCNSTKDHFSKDHTDVYNENWAKYGNNNGQFFDQNTFGMDLPNYINPCKHIRNNHQYRKLISQIMNCKGAWCHNEKYWKCQEELGENDCYHVEHIIDKRSPEFECDQCEDIAANLVMSYGQWDNELGRKPYDVSTREKEIVYGKDKMDIARYYINYCLQSRQLNQS